MLVAEKILFQKKIQNACATSTQIGIYWSQNCTNPVTSINWGMLSPGENKNITIYIRNEDNTTIRAESFTPHYEV